MTQDRRESLDDSQLQLRYRWNVAFPHFQSAEIEMRVFEEAGDLVAVGGGVVRDLVGARNCLDEAMRQTLMRYWTATNVASLGGYLMVINYKFLSSTLRITPSVTWATMLLADWMGNKNQLTSVPNLSNSVPS